MLAGSSFLRDAPRHTVCNTKQRLRGGWAYSILHERRRQEGEDKKGEAKIVMASVSVIRADCVYKAGLPLLFPSSSCSL
jgi:hypothetical protein